MKNLRLTEEQFAERQKKLAQKAAPKPSKYKNVKTNGFDSKKEAARYQELLILQSAGEIRDLCTQIPFDLIVNKMRICRYVADFVYYVDDPSELTIAETELVFDKQVVEDCKGVKTPIYRIKCKLMKAIYGIEIKET